MRKVIVSEFLSLDGVAQAPGGPEEDPSGGFAHGGWHMQYMEDERAQQWVLQPIIHAGAFLLGRRTYDIFAAYWPNAGEDQQVIAEPLNTKPKYVASRTRTGQLEWQNSRVLEGDVAKAVAGLKEGDGGGDLHTIGSTQLVQALIEHDLVDEFRLVIDPVLLGGGKGIFRDDAKRRPLRLVDAQIASTGAILATYARSG